MGIYMHSFWLAIAAFQQRYGVLMPEVKDKAIEIIDSGKSMEIWEDSDKRSIEKRKKVLAELKDKLQSPPLPRKKIPKPDIERHRWNVGDVVAGQLVHSYDSEKWFYNKFVLFKVIEIKKTSLSHIKPDLVYDEWVYGLMYDWVGDELIPAEQVNSLDYCPKLLQLKPGDIEWFNIHNKKAEGFELLGLNWVKRMIKFTLIESDENFIIPPDLKYHLLFGTGGNIFTRLKTHEDYFKGVYEKYKKV